MSESIWELEEFKPYKKRWDARQTELVLRRAYYDGTVYGKLKEQLGWLYPRLGKGIKPLFLPLASAVDVDAGIIPAGWLFDEEGEMQPLNVAGWVEARDLLFSWSKWDTDGVLFIHYGAQYGVSGLKVSDLRLKGRIVVKPVDPLNFMLIYDDPTDDEPIMSIWVEKRQRGEKEYEYAEVITPSWVTEYENGQPIMTLPDGADPNDPNSRVAGEPHDNGFVPYVEVRHMETGATLGEATFQKAIPLLDEVNQLATDLAGIIKKHGKPQWAISGAEPSDLVHSEDNVWFLPPEARVEILLPPVDIEGILAFLKEIKDGIDDALPERSFKYLREKDQIATATLELQLMELVLKIKRCRPNYDIGLTAALRMAGKMAVAGEWVGEGAADVRSLVVLDDPDLHIDPEREILPLDAETRMRLEMQEIALERERGMGISEGLPDQEQDQDQEDEPTE